jgi:transposase
MNIKKHKNHSAEFKSRVALDAIKGELTLNQISTKYGVHSSQIHRWKQLAIDGVKNSFNGKIEKSLQEDSKIVDDLYRQIGQLTCENDFLKKSAWK